MVFHQILCKLNKFQFQYVFLKSVKNTDFQFENYISKGVSIDTPLLTKFHNRKSVFFLQISKTRTCTEIEIGSICTEFDEISSNF